MNDERIAQNLELFRDIINGSASISYWRYDGNFVLLESDCPNEALFSHVIEAFGCLEALRKYAEEQTTPVTLGTPLGLEWLAACQRQNDAVEQIHLFGPVFTTDVSFKGIEQALNHCPELNVSIAWKEELIRALSRQHIPVITPLLLNQYLVMLHYCLTGEKMRISDISRLGKPLATADGSAERDRHKVWVAEKELLRAVREGDLNYRDALNVSANMSSGVPLHVADPLRQARDSVIVSISLVTRAAIEGGLSPEQAYSLGDGYIQSVENCRTAGDISSVHSTMLEDFVLRVHKCRTNPNASRQIRECCDYIELHAEEKITIASLAARVGYTEYYLSRKFKAEMNVALNDYIKIARIERAKFLLKTADDSIQTLASRLNFCSRSHFCETFRKIVGCSPVEYREQP